MTSFGKLKCTIIGICVGLIIGVVLYASVWVTPYIRDMPWYIALFLDIFGYWALAQYNFAPEIYFILAFTTIGALIGITIDLILNLIGKHKKIRKNLCDFL